MSICSFVLYDSSFLLIYLLSTDKILPDVACFGKITEKTEIIVTPFGQNVESSYKTKINKEENKDSLYQRLFNRNIKKVDGIIDSRTLDNVSEKSPSIDHVSSEYDQNRPVKEFGMKTKLKSQMRLFDSLIDKTMNQDKISVEFRAIPCFWSSFQMSEVYLDESIIQDELTFNSIYVLTCDTNIDNESDDQPAVKEFYVKLLPIYDDETKPNSLCQSILVPNILMAKMKIPKFGCVTLTRKMTVLNFLEKIEIVPSQDVNSSQKKMILEEFKRLLIKSSEPVLINQDQIFKLFEGQMLITVKIFPESFKYCLCDAEILRENKIVLSSQTNDLQNIWKISTELIPIYETFTLNEGNCYIQLDDNMRIIDDCVRKITLKIGLHDNNRIRRSNNYIIVGKTIEFET